jgi:hypothetical protein
LREGKYVEKEVKRGRLIRDVRRQKERETKKGKQ